MRAEVEHRDIIEDYHDAKLLRFMVLWYNYCYADVAQLVEQLIRNEQVTGSIPAIGSIFLVSMI